MAVFSQIRPVTLREQVAEQIRTAIIEGRLRPNDHVAEAMLTQQLGVSRTPVREALIILEHEALLVAVPNRGSFVREFQEQDVEDIFSMRTTLDNFTAELVIDRLGPVHFAHLELLIEQQRDYLDNGDHKQARRTDMAFHEYLVTMANHPLLSRSWRQIVAQVAAILYIRAEYDPDMNERLALSDHKRIVDALRDHDLDRVKAENVSINARVANECKMAVRHLQGRSVTENQNGK